MLLLFRTFWMFFFFSSSEYQSAVGWKQNAQILKADCTDNDLCGSVGITLALYLQGLGIKSQPYFALWGKAAVPGAELKTYKDLQSVLLVRVTGL